MQRWGPSQGRSSPWGVLTPAGIQGFDGRPERGWTAAALKPGRLPWPSPHLENGSGGESAPANPTEVSCKYYGALGLPPTIKVKTTEGADGREGTRRATRKVSVHSHWT